jgi:hypothetical protein
MTASSDGQRRGSKRGLVSSKLSGPFKTIWSHRATIQPYVYEGDRHLKQSHNARRYQYHLWGGARWPHDRYETGRSIPRRGESNPNH